MTDTVMAPAFFPSYGAQVVEALEGFFQKLRSLHDRPGHGGYFVIADGETGMPYVAHMIGMPELAKAQQYLANAMEKANRLASHPGHRLSWQSRVENYKFAGAVRVGNLIFSFSGLPELMDEALMLVLAVITRVLHRNEAGEIAALSSNEQYYTNVYQLATTR